MRNRKVDVLEIVCCLGSLQKTYDIIPLKSAITNLGIKKELTIEETAQVVSEFTQKYPEFTVYRKAPEKNTYGYSLGDVIFFVKRPC